MSKRASKRHENVLSNIKNNPALLLNPLGISNYEIGTIIIEPHALTSLRAYAPDIPSPDLVMEYYHKNELGIILAEIKGKIPKNTIPKSNSLIYGSTIGSLSRQVNLWKEFLVSKKGKKNLSTILGGKITLEELEICKLRVVGAVGTRKGRGVRVLADYELS